MFEYNFVSFPGDFYLQRWNQGCLTNGEFEHKMNQLGQNEH